MQLSLSIPGDIRAAETARRAVACFEARLEPELFDTLSLLVNELVTNSLLHACMGGEPIGLEVALGAEGGVRVSVSDPGNGFEVPTGEPRPEATSGRGLFLVDHLADRWGVEAAPQTRVWFEVSADGAIARDSATG